MKESKFKTYFGLTIYKDDDVLMEIETCGVHTGYVLEEEIKSLPFYEFWQESTKGSTMPIIEDKIYVYLHDWEKFSDLFIKTGKHRFSK